MNRYGLATWMSTRREAMPTEVEDYIRQIFTGNSPSVMPSNRGTQQSTFDYGQGLQPYIDRYEGRDLSSVDGQPYRVAAQDMFAELLALFKYNAITRFKSDNYDGYFIGDREQLDSNTWSEKYGDSKYVAAVRNNDVMRRGYVLMHTDRDTYFGFFKSLNFSEDAEKPFQWNFEFTFQVQKSVKTFVDPSK